MNFVVSKITAFALVAQTSNHIHSRHMYTLAYLLFCVHITDQLTHLGVE